MHRTEDMIRLYPEIERSGKLEEYRRAEKRSDGKDLTGMTFI